MKYSFKAKEPNYEMTFIMKNNKTTFIYLKKLKIQKQDISLTYKNAL